MEVTVCPGKEYYDLYPGYYEEEELPRPRVAVLKNTNIEAELLSQRRQGEATGRRVHYSVQDQEDIEYAAYHRWGPATLVNLSYQPDAVHSLSECGFEIPKTYQAPAHIWDLPR